MYFVWPELRVCNSRFYAENTVVKTVLALVMHLFWPLGRNRKTRTVKFSAVIARNGLFLFIALFSTACSLVKTLPKEVKSDVVTKVLLVQGVAQQHSLPQLSTIQNRLILEQAAKINAYRVLAKQLYSEPLLEDLLVAQQVIKNELFRVYLDLYLREAKVIEFKNRADHKIVTLALSLTPRFYQCLSSTVAIVLQCLQEDNKVPYTRIGYKQAAIKTVGMSCVSAQCIPALSITGFSKQKHALDKAMLNMGLYDAEWTANTSIKAMLHYLFIAKHVFN